MLGREPLPAGGPSSDGAIVLGTLDQIRRAIPQLDPGTLDAPDAYRVRAIRLNGARYIVVAAENDRGVLYGTFALLRHIASADATSDPNESSTPRTAVRWVNQWDNLDGSIERGYGGRSVFWDAGRARADLSRVTQYGRMLASIRHQRNLAQQRQRQSRGAERHADSRRLTHRGRAAAVGCACRAGD
jgi:alpha-glucuronidase